VQHPTIVKCADFLFYLWCRSINRSRFADREWRDLNDLMASKYLLLNSQITTSWRRMFSGIFAWYWNLLYNLLKLRWERMDTVVLRRCVFDAYRWLIAVIVCAEHCVENVMLTRNNEEANMSATSASKYSGLIFYVYSLNNCCIQFVPAEWLTLSVSLTLPYTSLLWYFR